MGWNRDLIDLLFIAADLLFIAADAILIQGILLPSVPYEDCLV